MGIFKSPLFSKLRKSVGNITMYELDGVQVVRAKTWKNDRQSPAQLTQRARMKAVKKLTHSLADAIHTGFPANNHSVSINRFVSQNIGLMNPDENGQTVYDISLLQLSSGELLPPAVTVVFDREKRNLIFTQERQPLHPLSPDNDRVYGIVWAKEEEESQVFPLRQRCEPGTTPVQLPTDYQNCSLEVFAFTVSANGKKTSRTIWLGSIKPTQ